MKDFIDLIGAFLIYVLGPAVCIIALGTLAAYVL